MQVLEALTDRRSVRDYTDELIPEETWRELLYYGTLAPSGTNMQPWAFVIVQGKEEIAAHGEALKQDLVEHLEDHPHLLRYRPTLENPNFRVLFNASNLLIIYGNTTSHFYVGDCAMAAHNITLAAMEKGIGSCWVGFGEYYFNTPEFREAHGVPEGYEIVCVMTLGYPAKPKGPARERRAPEIFSAPFLKEKETEE